MSYDSEDEEAFAPKEVRNPAARPGNVVHWVTYARRRGLGMWAWILHRATAIAIVLSTILHVLRNQFGVLTPGGRLLSLDLLLFAGAYHALNGMRVILIESFGWAAEMEDRLFILVLAASFLFIGYWVVVVGL